MALRLFQWLALLLTFIATLPAGAHLAALPNKMGLSQVDYFTVQQIYAGWALFGIVWFAALGTTLGYAMALRHDGRPYAYAIAAIILIVLNVIIFFIWTFPANQATSNWTVPPPNWAELRTQWEYSHAANALIMFAAFFCVLTAALRSPAGRPA
jgi:ABC-type branched-subunit amino acid transport system permease subunit